MKLRPLTARFENATLETYPLRSEDGFELGLSRVVRGDQEKQEKPAVLLTHGLTASTDMFVLPETRNFVEVLLDSGFEPWLLDWRGSCRLPYNEHGPSYTLDEVALYDMPQAVAEVRKHIGDRKLFMVAHCIGALSLSMSMAAGLVPGLDGVVAQGVFLTPKMGVGPRLRMMMAASLQPLIKEIPVDFRKVGLWSKYTPLFALASIGADCPDPTCQMVQNSAWTSGASLFIHDNLHEVTHRRLADLLGTCPTDIMSHIRKMELAHSSLVWHERDPRFSALSENSLDDAHRIDCPLLLLSGSENNLWLDSNKLCKALLDRRHPQLDAEYIEVPAYGHFDTFIGRSAALDVFPYITRWLNARVARASARVGKIVSESSRDRNQL